jgi:hypothetical protein
MADNALDRATGFVHRTARVLEQRRFRHLFGTPDPDGVRAALAAYRTADGGYGFALEPDGRGPSSQPLHADFALMVLAELGSAPSAEVDSLCGYLAGIALPDGGLPMVHASIGGDPKAPWWAVDESGAGSLIPTAAIVGHLHELGAKHDWLDAATEFCWQRIDAITTTHPYEVHNAITFLDRVPDRDRAERAAGRLGTIVRDSGYFLDPAHPERAVVAPGYAEGEHHLPHDYAPEPGSLARRWFTDGEFDRSLAHLAAAQFDDGGWTVPWAFWTPVTEFEWRPHATIQALSTLTAYDAGR